MCACVCLQCGWRCHAARERVRALVRTVYLHLIDEASGYPYYYNTLTGESQWTRPLSRLMGDEVMPMSSRQAAPVTARAPVTVRDEVGILVAPVSVTIGSIDDIIAQRESVVAARVRVMKCQSSCC